MATFWSSEKPTLHTVCNTNNNKNDNKDVMKATLRYSENIDMEEITGILSKNKELSPIILNGKVEAFFTEPKLSYRQTGQIEECDNISCNNERKPRSQSMGSATRRNTGRRPRASSLGDLSEPSTQQLLLNLTTTLNEAFPDYDFTNSKLEQFITQDVTNVINSVNGYFAELTVKRPDFLNKMWTAIDQTVTLRKCEVFAFKPDMSDENEDENIWSFNYFFYNKDVKTLVYLMCVANRQSIYTKYDNNDDDSDDERCCDEYDEAMSVDSADKEDWVSTSIHEYDEDEEVPQWDGVI